MLKVVKIGGISVGAGVVLGLSVVGYLYDHRLDGSADSVRAGLISLGVVPESTQSPRSTPTSFDNGPVLGVSAATNTDASGLINDRSRSNGVGDNSGNNLATPSPEPSLPGPSQFGIYDQFKADVTNIHYIDETPGTGATFVAGNTATVQYRGWLTNGKEFDESYARGKPFVFTQGQHSVIAGWDQGLLGMKAGGTRRLIIPPAFGYGMTGQGETISPNAVLVFDVELVAVH